MRPLPGATITAGRDGSPQVAPPLLLIEAAVAKVRDAAPRPVGARPLPRCSREEEGMAEFEIEGTTLLSWKTRIQAHSESEAREEAQRIAGRIEIPSGVATVEVPQHFIRRSRATDSGF